MCIFFLYNRETKWILYYVFVELSCVFTCTCWHKTRHPSVAVWKQRTQTCLSETSLFVHSCVFFVLFFFNYFVCFFWSTPCVSQSRPLCTCFFEQTFTVRTMRQVRVPHRSPSPRLLLFIAVELKINLWRAQAEFSLLATCSCCI